MPCSVVNLVQAVRTASRLSVVSVIRTGYGGSFGRGPVALGGGVEAQPLKLKASSTQSAARQYFVRHLSSSILCSIRPVRQKDHGMLAENSQTA
jgi:hypothetical protein